MIPKGNRRGGGQNLATHLLNAYNNDRVEVTDLRGFVARDLHGAFAEARAMASATRCRKYLYSLSVNPDLAKYDLTRDQYLDYIARAEKNLGLEGQPRAIVFHVKAGREHCHVVWSRIDPDRIVAVLNSHDRRILRRVTQEFARDHGLELPPGMRKDRGRDRFKDRKKVSNLKEQQQTERTGIPKAELKQEIQSAWDHSDNGHAFVAALEAKGYTLARGDPGAKRSRSHVVVDMYGEIHSLSRYLDVTAKEMRARLSSHPLENLPSVDEARAAAHAKQEQMRARVDEAYREKTPSADDKRKSLSEIQPARRLDLDQRRDTMQSRHAQEMTALRDLHDADNKGILAERLAKQPRGLAAFLTRITGIRAISEYRHRRADQMRAARQKTEVAALARKHGREAEDMAAHYHDLARLEKRENSSMALQLRREKLKLLIGGPRTIQPEFERAAKGQDGASAASGGGAAMAEKFKRAAEGPRLSKGDLQAAFEKAEATRAAPEKPAAKPKVTGDEERREQARRLAEELRRHTPARDPDKDRER